MFPYFAKAKKVLHQRYQSKSDFGVRRACCDQFGRFFRSVVTCRLAKALSSWSMYYKPFVTSKFEIYGTSNF